MADGSPQLWRSPTTTLWHIDAGSGGRPPHQVITLNEAALLVELRFQRLSKYRDDFRRTVDGLLSFVHRNRLHLYDVCARVHHHGGSSTARRECQTAGDDDEQKSGSPAHVRRVVPHSPLLPTRHGMRAASTV